MELYKDKIKPVCIELWKSKVNDEIGCTEWGRKELHNIDSYEATTLCIIYPKGKRPDLGYPVNNKIEEK